MIFVYGLIGAVAGIIGGMGMGGGTLLIPLLTIFSGISQHSAQAMNLISFIPMATVALFFHFKNKMVDFKGVLTVILSGLVACIIGVYLSRKINGDVLGRVFGGFLIILAVIQCVLTFVKKND